MKGVYKRGDKWMVDKTKKGKRFYQVFDEYEQAERYVHRINAQISGDPLFEKSNFSMPFDEWCAEVYHTYVVPKLRGVKTYESSLKRLSQYFGNKPMHSVRTCNYHHDFHLGLQSGLAKCSRTSI